MIWQVALRHLYHNLFDYGMQRLEVRMEQLEARMQRSEERTEKWMQRIDEKLDRLSTGSPQIILP